MKPYIKSLIPVALALTIWIVAGGWTMNGQQAGSTASATPEAVGTSTPVAVVTCATSLYSFLSNPQTLYLDFEVSGGSTGTDGCYLMPAPVASPCAAASPAPSVSLKRGYFAPTGGSGFQHTVINYPMAGGASILSSEWDAVCTTGTMYVGVATFP